MSSVPETLRPSPLGQGSSSSSRFTIATPVGPSSPSPLINQPSIKDCPHRGDLLGHRTETSRASHGVMAMDPPSPPQPIPLTGLIRPGSISAMLREMQQELPQRPFFPSGTNILRPIAPLPLRRADVSTDTQTPFDPFSLSSASNGREDQLLIFRQPQDHRAIAAPVPNRIRPSSQNAPMSQRQSGNAYESTGMESIPAPRASRRAENHEEEHERIDFSPHRLGRRPRDIEWSTSAFRPTRSREHDDRLVRLDALRAGDIHDVGVIAPSHANLPSTRQGRYPMDESRDFRSRQASSEITPMDIVRWNRDIHEAIERRVGDALSPASAVMRHQEIVTASQPYQSPMVFSQPTGSRWGDLNPASPQRRNRLFHLERSLGVLDTMSGESVSLDGFDDQDTFYADINWDEAERLFDFASSSSETLLAQVHGTIGVNRLTETMSKDEKMRKIRSAAKGVSRWPGHCRRSAAEETLHMLPWKDVVNSEEMIKDAYCSVCHDDYEEDSQITVTPCKHMYHKECLDTWLHTPNTSSCPMCRRDLAVLLCITRMVPTQSRREALPLWLEL